MSRNLDAAKNLDLMERDRLSIVTAPAAANQVL
jgi:hypothetical protein